ncbi:MAG: hypothetical protein ABSC06_34725 [Rhodopila sp.]
MRSLNPCLIALTILTAAIPASAQDAPSYVTPYVPSRAAPGVGQKARAAAIRFLSAQCTLNEAHRQAVDGSNEEANRLIGDARTAFADSAQMFLNIAKIMNANIVLNPPDRDEVTKAIASLGRYDIKKPGSYVGAFVIMHDEIDRGAARLSDIRFRGSESDLRVLAAMIDLQGRMAEVFLDITTLTVFGAT